MTRRTLLFWALTLLLACGEDAPPEIEGLHRRGGDHDDDGHDDHGHDDHGHDDHGHDDHGHDDHDHDDHGHDDHGHDDHDDHHGHAHGPDDHVIALDAEAQRRLGIVVGRAIAGRLAPSRSTVARLEAPPDQLALVAAPVDGRLVARPGGLPRPGTTVRRGELLATLVPTPSAPEITTRVASDLSRANADVEAARLALDRARALLAEGAVPERRVLDAQRDLGVAEAALASARQTSAFAGSARGGRGGAGWRVVATIDGVIDATFVSDGQTVAAHTPLFRVVGEGERWVVVSVPETWAPSLGSSPRGFFRLAGETSARPLERLVDVGRVVDPHTRAVEVRFAVDADPALRVGAAANAELTFGDAREGFLVPRAAVLDLDGRRIVVLRVADDEFLERDVSVAVRAGDQLLLTEGVTAEDAVVLEGAALVHLAKGGGGEVHDGHVH